MNKCIVDDQKFDLEKVLYEKSNTKTIYDALSVKPKTRDYVKRVYLILLGLILLGWFLYSLINEKSVASVLSKNVITTAILFICEVILI